MATLHIRDLKDSVKERLRIRAAEAGRSMEAEARTILEAAVLGREPREPEEHPYRIIRRAVAKYRPLDIEFPPRGLADDLTGAQFVALVSAAVDKYGPLDIEIPPRGRSHREIPDFG
jgi:plasmid stability protein